MCLECRASTFAASVHAKLRATVNFFGHSSSPSYVQVNTSGSQPLSVISLDKFIASNFLPNPHNASIRTLYVLTFRNRLSSSMWENHSKPSSMRPASQSPCIKLLYETSFLWQPVSDISLKILKGPSVSLFLQCPNIKAIIGKRTGPQTCLNYDPTFPSTKLSNLQLVKTWRKRIQGHCSTW